MRNPEVLSQLPDSIETPISKPPRSFVVYQAPKRSRRSEEILQFMRMRVKRAGNQGKNSVRDSVDRCSTQDIVSELSNMTNMEFENSRRLEERDGRF